MGDIVRKFDRLVALSGSKTLIWPVFCKANQRGLATGSTSIFVTCVMFGRFGKASATSTLAPPAPRAGATQVRLLGRESRPTKGGGTIGGLLLVVLEPPPQLLNDITSNNANPPVLQTGVFIKFF
jgi:hypothetical protein